MGPGLQNVGAFPPDIVALTPAQRHRLDHAGSLALGAPAAYRADAIGGRSFGVRDGGWIVVASVLEHAAGPSERSADLVRQAVELARDLLGTEVVRSQGDREFQTERTPSEVIILLADDAYEAGAYNTAIAILDALRNADRTLSPIQRGRILARRARSLGRLGRLDDAADHFRTLERLGRETNSDELRVRAWIGLGAVAQMSGNYPAMASFSKRALTLAARTPLRFLERYARIGLMIVAGANHDFDAALQHGWAVYIASLGHSIEEGEILQILGQLMLEARQYTAARAAFGAVISRELPVRILLPAVGGLARAAAETQRHEVVNWAVQQLRRAVATSAPRYLVATALLECAIALNRIGQSSASAALRSQATGIAKEHCFHEVVIRAEAIEHSIAGDMKAPPLRRRASDIAHEVVEMEPDQLPNELLVLAEPA